MQLIHKHCSQINHGIEFIENSLFSKSNHNISGIDIKQDKSDVLISLQHIKHLLKHHYKKNNNIKLPSCSEQEICTHFTRLSRKNFCIDTNSYPLGSCTMKYNPKINEWAARLYGFTSLHPYLPETHIQGALSIMYDLQNWLTIISGLNQTSLQVSAGAQGEFLGLLIMLKALKHKNIHKTEILIPDSAHGTNSATAAFFGLKVISIKSNQHGYININEIQKKINKNTLGIMITNPNTLGIFEKNILEISKIIHNYNGFVYGDGANLNALMGIVKPRDLGIDIMHFNLHKTFSTPHGGGGPGGSAISVSKTLSPFLPCPLIKINHENKYYLHYDNPLSVGKIRSFYGNFGIMIRAWTYIKELGCHGLKRASELAVLNANYIKSKLKPYFNIPYNTDCLHEIIINDKKQKKYDIETKHIAKRLIDYGIHPPTIYFPLIVPNAIMIEPTETENKKSLDKLCDAFISIALESMNNNAIIKSAPNYSMINKLNETIAARKPILTFI